MIFIKTSCITEEALENCSKNFIKIVCHENDMKIEKE